MGPGDEDHDLLGVHDGAHADGERLLRHQAHVAAEETGVCLDRLLRKRQGHFFIRLRFYSNCGFLRLEELFRFTNATLPFQA